MATEDLKKLDPLKFTELIPNREKAIASASAEIPASETGANRLARLLHPDRQYLTVEKIDVLPGAKTFHLKPDVARGTEHCAYFSAGQYLTVYVETEGRLHSRPYSIVSSPREALEGTYQLTVKAVDGGLVSNFILEHWQIGTPVTVSGPTGNFTYEPLRDASHILGIAGGSGITPFISLAKAIADGDEACSLTLLYGSRREKDILFHRELDALCAKSEKIKVIHVLSDEQRHGYESGYITEGLIRKYAPEAAYSVFLCGPKQMIAFADRELSPLQLPGKFIRHEVHGEILNPETLPDHPGCKAANVTVTVHMRGKTKTIPGNTGTTILRILEENGITPPSRCRSGECGFCHSRLISGEVYLSKKFDRRRQADAHYGYIHPCCTYPLSDLEIEVSEG